MARVASVASFAVAVAALVIAAAALREARKPAETPTYAEITAAAVEAFTAAGNRMTPEQVSRLLGQPSDVYRDNPRALCWRYTSPYRIDMCWGPKRQQAWIAHNIPPEFDRSARGG